MSGLYINTNVNSMTAATNLTNNMNGLSDVLTRLSTGLRINSAKDDPAGLIASETLRSEITSSTAALKNTQRATSMIATADSALGQVGDLLNDIRGLVNEAANTGAMSAEQIEANQLQIDASLDAIDRIGMSTTYMGKKLLDGSMSFQTAGLNSGEISNLVVSNANFGTRDSVGVQIDVQAASTVASQVYTQGALGSDGAAFKVTGSQGSQTFNFGAYTTTAAMAEQINAYSDSTGVRAIAGSEATTGIINITSAGTDNDIILEAKTAGEAAGNYSVKFTAGSADGISYQITNGVDGNPSTVEFQLKMDEWKNASGTVNEASLGIYDKDLSDGTNGFRFSSTTGSNVKEVKWVVDGNAPANNPTAIFDKSTGVMTISGNAGATAASIVTAVNAVSNLTGVSTSLIGAGLTLPTANEVVSTTDARANNGLTLTSKTGDTSMNGTGVVVVGDAAATGSSATIGDSTNGLTITADAVGEEWDGYQIQFVQGTAADGSAVAAVTDAANKTITVTVNNTGGSNDVAYSVIETALNGLNIDSITGGSGDLFGANFTTTAVGQIDDGVTTMPATATTAGGALVEFNYVDTAQSSSAVIQSGSDYIQFKATSTGADYNGYTFNFAQDGTASGVSVALNETDKVITINGNFSGLAGGATLAQVNDAVNGLKNSEGKQIFQMSVYGEDPTNNVGATRVTDLTRAVNATLATPATGTTQTGTKFGQIGTEAGALIVTLRGEDAAAVATIEAQDVIDAFNNASGDAALKELQAMFSLGGAEGAGTDGTMFLAADFAGNDTKTLSYNGALQGGSNGNVSNTTAKELMDFINSDATLSKLFEASLATNSQQGNGKVSLFDEVAYYGNPYDETGLQFLGPDNSQNIQFATNGANQDLSITWMPDVIGDAKANLAAYNANASLSLDILKDDAKYDDMVVRFKRVNQDQAASSVVYQNGPSNALAYGSVSNDNTDINAKFIFEAKEGGDRFNNIALKANIDGTQQAAATFALNEATGEFMITVNSGSVTLAQVVDAFNQSELSSKFKFELDYSDVDATGGAGGTPRFNDGSSDFSSLLKANGQVATLGNTGTTGGHTGGVLEITLADDGTGAGMAAQNVVDLVNNSSIKDVFRVTNYTISDGTGEIHARYDTVGSAYDPQSNNSDTNGHRMITTGGIQKGKLVVNLATDAAGNSTTTAADLVAYFDTLTAEQTKGISVSLNNAGGGEVSLCGPGAGGGLLKATSYLDLCDNLIESDIAFGSTGSETKNATALSEIVAVNGKDAGFTLFSKNVGTNYEGIKMVYEHVDTPDKMNAKYDATSRTLTVSIQDNVTTASQVKDLVEKTGLFTVQLRDSGAGAVTVNDNSISLTNGSYETAPKGGASMMWNSDDTSNEMFLESIETGSNQYVQIDVFGGTFGTVDSYTGQVQSRSYGTDIEATVNGQNVQSTGNNISLNTTNLSFTATLNANADAGDSYSFDIVSGGALFQLGPDVISSQQVRLGIPSVMTSDLGGTSGKLSDLRSGGKADLSNEQSVKLADRIVKEAITTVSSTRGRLGAVQKATLESNMVTLENSIEALTAARSDIIDADFAQESSNLTKYQILVQSGSRVLSIANQLPQYAASLIG